MNGTSNPILRRHHGREEANGSVRRILYECLAVGEPTIEKGVDKALTGAANVVKHSMDATTDEITSELQEALKS